MQTLELKKIGKQFHPFQKDTFTLKRESIFSDKAYELNAKNILKYAPRYAEFLTIHHWKDRRLINALKRVKKISIISCGGFISRSPNQWRLVLQNKFKSVEKFLQETDRWGLLEHYKAFSKMTEIRPSGNDSFLWSLFRYVPGMANLQSFHWKIFPKTHPNLLKRINLMSRTLSSLKTIDFTLIQYKETEQKISFSAFVENKNILGLMTHLTLDGVEEANFSNTFELLSISCNKLKDLSLYFWDVTENLRALKSLKGFENLERVIIQSRDLSLFIGDLTFPSSIKDIKIELEGKSRRLISIAAQSLVEMSVNQRMTSFAEKWSNLHNLTTLALKMKIRKSPKAIPILIPFVQKILESIPSLVNLDLELAYSDNDFKDSIDLTNIFGALQRFSEKLQRIRIDLPHSGFLTQLSKQDVTFPKLTRFELSLNKISDLGTIQNIFGAFERRPSLENIEISFGKFIVKSNQTLLDLLHVLKKPPRNSNVKFRIEIKRLNFGMCDEMFGEFIERVKRSRIVKGSWLVVQIKDDYYDRGVEFLAFLKEMFGKVEFQCKRRRR